MVVLIKEYKILFHLGSEEKPLSAKLQGPGKSLLLKMAGFNGKERREI